MTHTTTDTTTKEAAAKPPTAENKPPTAGQQYVTTYLLQEVGNDADQGGIAESIDGGFLLVCPRCHFLHLPARPFPLSCGDKDNPPVDDCDVCAALPEMCNPMNWGTGWETTLPHAGEYLIDERAARATTLYRLWIEATNGADALRVAAIAESVSALRRQARSGGAKGEDEEGGPLTAETNPTETDVRTAQGD